MLSNSGARVRDHDSQLAVPLCTDSRWGTCAYLMPHEFRYLYVIQLTVVHKFGTE